MQVQWARESMLGLREKLRTSSGFWRMPPVGRVKLDRATMQDRLKQLVN